MRNLLHNSNNLEVCLDFAKKNNLMSDDELEEAEKVSKVLKEGAQLPGGCKNKKNAKFIAIIRQYRGVHCFCGKIRRYFF